MMLKDPFPPMIVPVDVVPSPQLIRAVKLAAGWAGSVSVNAAIAPLNPVPSARFRPGVLVNMTPAESALVPITAPQASIKVLDRWFKRSLQFY